MRSLWPREHGAYAQLGAPLLAALLVGAPTRPAIALGAAACLAFLANEPLLVVLGHRGPRLRTTLGPAARRRLAVTVGGSAVLAALGIALAPPNVLALAAFAAVPVCAMLALAWRKSMHSVRGELVAAVALPGAVAPIAVAAGISVSVAATMWLAWSFGYAASVVAVHEILRRQRRRPPGALLAVALLGLAWSTWFAPALVAALPLVAISALVCVRLPPARRVRAVGVALACASVVSVVVAVIASR